jgi:anti-sigma28 factor (negative regulator of flagellin synthesis)
MRIHGSGVGQVSEREKAEKKDASKPAGITPGVVVSAKARELGEAVAAERNARAERLAALKEAVTSGRYKVDYEKAAQRFFEDEVEGKPR